MAVRSATLEVIQSDGGKYVEMPDTRRIFDRYPPTDSSECSYSSERGHPNQTDFDWQDIPEASVVRRLAGIRGELVACSQGESFEVDLGWYAACNLEEE